MNLLQERTYYVYVSGTLLRGTTSSQDRLRALFQDYIKAHFGVSYEESHALLIAGDEEKMLRFTTRTTAEWMQLARQTAAKVRWDKLPATFDDVSMS